MIYIIVAKSGFASMIKWTGPYCRQECIGRYSHETIRAVARRYGLPVIYCIKQ